MRFIPALFLLILSHQAMAWENHAKLTQIVLNDWASSSASASQYLNQSVKVESLKSFLNATKASLPARMNDIEQWAHKHEQGYKSLPDNLSYQPSRSDCAHDIELCFRKALRMNLDVPLRPIIYGSTKYYSPQKGFVRITDGHMLMPAYVAEKSTLEKDIVFIPPQGKVKVSDLISISSMQPDFGFDTFLYEDSPSSFGKLYQFGTQPLGNAKLPFNSQMLFHMSSYHDDSEILAAIPRLNEDYPEYRAFLYMSLSRFAAEHHHPYWAAVFLGWGLHYVQDMTQPYHSKIAYGLDANIVLQALGEAAKNNYQPFSDMEIMQINRHVMLENLTNAILNQSNLYKSILEKGLTNKSFDVKVPPCDMQTLYLRKQIKTIPGYETVLLATVPSDVNEKTDFNKIFLQKMNKAQRLQFTEATAQALLLYGAYTRACVLRQ